jgi:hypothetical protein
VKDNPGSAPARLTTPDGYEVSTGSFPSGDLLAAWRASGAPDVVAASSAMGLGRVGRAAIPPVAMIMRSARLRRFAAKRLAALRVKDAPKTRPFSWSYARVEWSDGTAREGWLKVGDGMDFTTAAASTIAVRLTRGEGKPPIHTWGIVRTVPLDGHRRRIPHRWLGMSA